MIFQMGRKELWKSTIRCNLLILSIHGEQNLKMKHCNRIKKKTIFCFSPN